MRFFCLQHESFEGPGFIAEWLLANGHTLEYAHLYLGNPLPKQSDFDGLIIMGGTMSVNHENQFNWLLPEKQLIAQAIGLNKIVIGICLGAQLIANALGKRVYKNTYREIGWWPIKTLNHRLTVDLPANFDVFHWHGETFELPDGAIRLFESEGCLNQGFVLNHHVLALQFHLEVRPTMVTEMSIEGDEEINAGGKFVQSAEDIKAGAFNCITNQNWFALMLCRLFEGN